MQQAERMTFGVVQDDVPPRGREIDDVLLAGAGLGFLQGVDHMLGPMVERVILRRPVEKQLFIRDGAAEMHRIHKPAMGIEIDGRRIRPGGVGGVGEERHAHFEHAFRPTEGCEVVCRSAGQRPDSCVGRNRRTQG